MNETKLKVIYLIYQPFPIIVTIFICLALIGISYVIY